MTRFPVISLPIEDMPQALARPPARWLFPGISKAAALALSRGLGLSPLIGTILLSRGIDSIAAARDFLSPDLDSLCDPFAMRDMRAAVQRIKQALRLEQPILLYGDYDVDGTCSIVILKRALELLGGKVLFHLPDRLSEGYGMRAEIVERAAGSGVKLVISVDTGIRAAAVVRHASSLGIDVIVTDHHLPDADVPPGLAILNPNQPDCTYPNKHLCGAGVTLKLIQALLAQTDMSATRRSALLDAYLKPVAIATVADIVPLTGENRVIVQRGLSGLRDVRNIGLKALLAVAGFGAGECPSAHQVAFRLAPRINAAGRLANASDVVELFLTNDALRAHEIAQQLDALNRERQQLEAAIVEEIAAECEKMSLESLASAVVFSGPDWHPGVLGIVASRMVESLCRPVFVLSESQQAGLFTGSGRSIPGFHLLEALEDMPDLFTRFGGHRQAAGLTLPATKLEQFRERFAAFAASRLKPEDLCPTYAVDAEAGFPDLNEQTIQQLFALGPFGFGNPMPTLCATNAEVAGPAKTIKDGKHFSVPIRHANRLLWCKAWNFRQKSDLLQAGARVDVLFQVEDDPVSTKRGYGNWCVSLKDIRATAHAN